MMHLTTVTKIPRGHCTILVTMVTLLFMCGADAARNKAPYMDVKNDYEQLVTAYKTTGVGVQEVRPRENQSLSMTVSLGMSLYGVLDFNAVDGILNIIGSMYFEWQDDIVTIANLSLGMQKETIFVEPDQIWTPNIVLMNDAENIHRIGDSSYKVRFNLATGKCQWKPRMIINAACTANMLYYPFDKQVCTLQVTPWFQKTSSVRLRVLTDAWDLDDFVENGIWALDSTSSRAYHSNGQYYADFEITIKRKPLFLAIVIVLPVLLLTLLTGFLFLLPADSGSRVGFGVTCFLSFVVILQTLMNFMPETSVPMSLLCFYIIVMLMFSAFLSIFNIFILRLYLLNEHEEVSAFYVRLMDVITCRLLRRTYRRVRRVARHFNADMSKKWETYKENKRLERRRNVVGYHEETKRGDLNFRTKYISEKPRFYKPYIGPKIAETRFDGDSVVEEVAQEVVEQETMQVNDDSVLFCSRNRNTETSLDVFKNTVSELAVNQELKKGKNSALVKVGPGEYRTKAEIIKCIGRVIEEPAPEVDDSKADDVKLVNTLTWNIVGGLLDYFFLITFMLVQIIFSVIFLVPILTQ